MSYITDTENLKLAYLSQVQDSNFTNLLNLALVLLARCVDESGNSIKVSGLGGGGGGGVSVERTPYLILVEDSLRVTTSGCVGLSVAVTGENPALVINTLIPAGVSIEFPIPDGDTLSAVTVDATGTSVLVLEVR